MLWLLRQSTLMHSWQGQGPIHTGAVCRHASLHGMQVKLTFTFHSLYPQKKLLNVRDQRAECCTQASTWMLKVALRVIQPLLSHNQRFGRRCSGRVWLTKDNIVGAGHMVCHARLPCVLYSHTRTRHCFCAPCLLAHIQPVAAAETAKPTRDI